MIITTDPELVAEVSIARNFQNDVQTISIIGRLQELDEIEERFKKEFPDHELRKKETERPSDDNSYIETEKLLQVVAALLPDALWWKGGEPNKTYTYDRKAACLRDFDRIYKGAKNPDDTEHELLAMVYAFYLDVVPQAWSLYTRWKSHQGFAGTGLRSILREGREIVDVPDGILFPIRCTLRVRRS